MGVLLRNRGNGLKRTAVYGVAYQEETGPVGSYVPTLGYPTSAADMYRVGAIVETGHEGWNSCYTDVHTCNSLARLIEGPINARADLQDAETALQLLMWHDRVDVLVPGFKYSMGPSSAYARADDPRTELAFSLFGPCVPYDHIFAVERVEVEDGRIKGSTLRESPLIEMALDEAKRDYLSLSAIQAAVLASVPIDMGVPAYLTDHRLTSFTGKRGFFGKFYAALEKDWNAAMASVPDVEAVVPMPPLLAVALTRASSRSTIPDAITEMRDELAPVRTELLGLAQLVQGARKQVEIEQKCADVQRSFEAVLAASRYPEPSFLFPLLRLYKAAKSPLETLITMLNPEYVPRDPRLVANRTVTGRTFSKLLQVDSMHSLVTHFFTAAEIQALEKGEHEQDA